MNRIKSLTYEVKNKIKMAHENRNKSRDEFKLYVKEVIDKPVVQQMKKYNHHSHTNCFEHSMHVSYYNYVICKKFGLDYKAGARAGLLHDLFLYDWHTHAKKTGDHFHGLTHPKTALKNASKFFELNEIEKDIIYNHMWPVTFFRIPKTKEGFITTLTDKYCGACETSKRR